jgi:guanylate kinase
VPEKNGNEYWFKSEEEFLRDLRKNNYIEAAIIHNQQVSGINVQELRHASQTGAIPITDVDIQGCDTIMSVIDKAIPIFILPPDFPEWMSRLDGRGAMERSEKIRRLTSATNEIELALERSYFKFMVNYDLRLTIETLHEHIISGQFGELEQSNARMHAQKLLTDLDKYLH